MAPIVSPLNGKPEVAAAAAQVVVNAAPAPKGPAPQAPKLGAPAAAATFAPKKPS